MELKLEEGRYIARNKGGLETVSGAQEIAQRVGLKLKARRGGFIPLPNFGSRLHLLQKVRPSEREAAARQYIMEALSDETDLSLESLSLEEQSEGIIRINLVFGYGGGLSSFSYGLEVTL